MCRPSANFLISLNRAPKILRMSGRRTHGLRGKERYRLDRFWCLNLFQGEGELLINGRSFPFRRGYAGITKPGVDLVYVFRQKTIKTWAHFIPDETDKDDLIDIPIMQDLGIEFDRVRAEIELLSSFYRAQPARAVAHFWDILWHLVPFDSQSNANNHAVHPLVRRAMDEIDMHISENLCVGNVAGELGISQTHLNRLFRAAIGSTIGEYIKKRRMDLAQHLLAHTTMPIKEIACHVGIPDPQYFNKSVRHQFGVSPKKLRMQV